MYCSQFQFVLLLLSAPVGKGHTRGPDLPAHSACRVPFLTSRQFLASCEAPNVQNRVRNSPLFVRIRSHMIPVHTFQSYFIKIHLHVRLSLTSSLFPSPIRATCPAHLILVNLITPQVSVAYKPSSLSLCHFHQLLLTLSQNIASIYHLL